MQSQIMKKNKIKSLMLTGVLAASMAVPAFAVNINIGGTGAEFQAYKLLNLTTSEKECDITDAGHVHSDACQYNYSYTLNSKYDTVLKAVTGGATEDEIIDYLEHLSADKTRKFADDIYARVKDMAADKTASGKTITGVDQGYYLIVETKKDGDSDTYSLVMLDTAGQNDITVATKEGTPTLEKKIVDNGKDVDAADYNIGDLVSFKLTGTMPDNIDGYKTYKYIMHDSLSAGLAFKAGSVKVAIDGTTITDGFEVKTTGLDEGCSFEVAFTDIKTGHTITKNTKVVVTYDAELTADADIGNPGNPNDAHLEYSSNPNAGGEGETSVTPPDKVAAFTFEVIVNKVDKKGDALKGAGFTLYKVEAGKDDTVIKAFEAGEATSFTFTGLDSGKYKLVETTVPDGYNKADDVEFEIVSKMDGADEESSEPKLTSLKVMQGDKEISTGDDATFTVTLDAGQATTKVVNTTGIRLPSTGGMGTYVIYGGGAALVAGGIVLAVVKKKKDSGAEA